MSKFILTSPAFKNGESIPSKYTCDGEDLSPPLAWTDPPQGTASFALLVDDPDAPVGDWVHWLLYNIPSDAHEIPESGSVGISGINSWPKPGYGGPCPPNGTHRYFFKLYALDTMLTLSEGAKKADLLKAIEGHVLAQAELMGIYARP